MMLFTFTDGLLFSFLSIVTVFIIIGLIITLISPLKKFSPQNKDNENHNQEIEKPTQDKLDEDMIVAVLIASIDFRETTNKEPKLLSIKIYKVKVNGKVYEVELESVEESNQSIQNNKNTNSTKAISGDSIKSPMQGTIQKIMVQPGQSVKKGDSLLVLEAMKLENDITAEKDYQIEELLVKEGDTVNAGQPLIKVS
jgi:biotin carboxyl carrier protein